MKHSMIQTKAAIISAQSSKNLDKVEYLTGKDLGLKPGTAEEVKFDISPLGKIFNKGLSEEDLVDNAKGGKKLLKGLKTKYFHFIMIENVRDE